jgi:radical SAM superfamily enzyme YgiQ (UPF0313 family)
MYELGRQPFGLASPAAWLRVAGHEVACVDLAVAELPALTIREADVVALYLPMHTATRLAAKVVERVRLLNPRARLCCYGLYAPMNAEYLRSLGVETIIGGEFEPGLVAAIAGEQPPPVSFDRLRFITPERSGLPALSRYAKLHVDGSARVVGYTEASRGCKHLCRHCPIVPVYQGQFRVVQPEVVLDDIAQQVAAGAAHITFGDADFFNGPTHARRIVDELHRRFPGVTYDATIKVSHLRQHGDLLPVLRDTGCLFVTTAVESVDDTVLEKLDKGHTRADFIEVVREFRAIGLTLAPTFIPFTPWTTGESYRDLLALIRELDLVENVSPVQLTLRLLIVPGSKLLELADIQAIIERFDESALVYRWRHSDPDVDTLQREALRLVHDLQKQRASRREIFAGIWELAHGAPPDDFDLRPRAIIPYMDEPWYC